MAKSAGLTTEASNDQGCEAVGCGAGAWMARRDAIGAAEPDDGGGSHEGAGGQSSARRCEGERSGDHRRSNSLLRDSRAVVQGGGAWGGAETGLSAARSAECARRQGGQRARRVSRRGAASTSRAGGAPGYG